MRGGDEYRGCIARLLRQATDGRARSRKSLLDNTTPPAIAALETNITFSTSLGDLGKLPELRFDP
jgi:hypothetical protein